MYKFLVQNYFKKENHILIKMTKNSTFFVPPLHDFTICHLIFVDSIIVTVVAVEKALVQRALKF